MESWEKSIVPLSQHSFTALLRHIVATGVRAAYFSRHAPVLPFASLSEFARIDLVLSGVKHMRFPDGSRIAELNLEPGCVHYSPPMTAKLPLWDSPHEMSSIVFSRDFLRVTYINLAKPIEQQDIATPYFYHTATPPGENARRICGLLNQLAERPSRHGMELPLLEALLREVLEELENDSAVRLGKNQLTWLQASQYVQENFTSPINRAHVARELKLSPGYLSRLFRDNCGETFVGHLRRLRLEYACRLLTESSCSIDEITTFCGYQSSTFFINAFRKRYGLSPGHFRERSLRGRTSPVKA